MTLLSPDEQRRLDELERQLTSRSRLQRIARRLGPWRVPVALTLVVGSTVGMVAVLAVSVVASFSTMLTLLAGVALLVPEPSRAHPAEVAARLRIRFFGGSAAEGEWSDAGRDQP
ncbi:MAG: hypothetical protein S0880_03985 [Actinomycetota bacterium]|nr:hypothetical protein [Actinomycetota bacterium]